MPGAPIKMAISSPFVLKPNSLGQPGLDRRGAVFCFPLFQSLLVAALCFHDFARVRVFVAFHLARLAAAGFRFGRWSTAPCLRIKQVDYVFQAVAVFCEQITELRFELYFFLKTCVAF